MNKKIWLLLLSVFSAFTIISCGNNEKKEYHHGEPLKKEGILYKYVDMEHMSLERGNLDSSDFSKGQNTKWITNYSMTIITMICLI